MRVALLVLGLVLVAPAVARAQDPTAQDLVGTWKRDDGRLIRLEVDPASGELVGKMLNPPAANDAETLFYSVDLRLKLEGKKLDGKAIWIEPNPKKGAQPESWQATTRWDLSVDGPGKLAGKTEWLLWSQGIVKDRGSDDHTFERLPVLSLGSGAPAPEKVDAAVPIDGLALQGTWRSPHGFVRFRGDGSGAGFVMERVKGEGPFPGTVKLANQENVLRGSATWDGGQETKVELALTAAGKLQGRAEKIEGQKGSESRGWTALALERLPRVDAGPAGEAGPLPAGSGPLASLYKRDDGLSIKLTPKGDGFEGELVSKTDGPKAKLELSPAGEGRFQGKAVFQVDGSPVEVKWELAPGPDGTLEGRCEWIDWDPETKTAAARGVSARSFKAYRRLG